MAIVDSRGPKYGQCNICGVDGALTEDHTPPKGYATALPMQIAHIAARLAAEKRPRIRKAPDGVKYRSLCHRCNSLLLGTEYDPELIGAARQVTALLNTSVAIPAISVIRVKPQRLARSVLGHLAAQGVGRYKKGAMTEPLRDYILNPSLRMIPDIRFVYWVYPYHDRILIRDAAITSLRAGKNPSIIWVMKSFPLGFAVLFNRDFQFERYQNVRDFDAYVDFGVDDTVDLPIDLLANVHPFWPEAPHDNTILLMGKQAVAAMPSPPRSKVIQLSPSRS